MTQASALIVFVLVMAPPSTMRSGGFGMVVPSE
jgi:hypothetical protein